MRLQASPSFRLGSVHPAVALRKFAYAQKPSASEVSAARIHVATIRRRLGTRLGVKQVVLIGSHARGTAIRRFSDLDVMAILPRVEARWGGELIAPSTCLSKIREQLSDRFVQTKVRTDGQAVVVHFGNSTQAVDVVPAVFLGFEFGRPMYRIPDSDGDWIKTSPARHQRLFDESADRSGGKLRGLAQLIRAWKCGRDPPIPISSFFVDLLLCKTDVAAGVSSYGECLHAFFAHLARIQGRGIRDPEQVAGIVSMATTLVRRERVQGAAEHALDHANAALRAEKAGRFDEAVRQWGIVFNHAL